MGTPKRDNSRLESIRQFSQTVNHLLLTDVVCITLLSVSVYVILGEADAATKNWAFGTAGLMLGRILGTGRR